MNRVIVLLIAGVLSACAHTAPATDYSVQRARCPPLPATFNESDLVGTWGAEYGNKNTDTLILNDDGTYRQIYDDPVASFHYESNWLKWRVEHRASGYLRLHMEGMRRCDSVASLCKSEGGGVGDHLIYDYCEGRGVNTTEGEVILVVTGVPERYAPSTLRGIWLRHARLSDPDAPDYHFEPRR